MIMSHIRTHTHKRTHTRAHAHTHTHTHTHTQIYSPSLALPLSRSLSFCLSRSLLLPHPYLTNNRVKKNVSSVVKVTVVFFGPDILRTKYPSYLLPRILKPLHRCQPSCLRSSTQTMERWKGSQSLVINMLLISFAHRSRRGFSES